MTMRRLLAVPAVVATLVIGVWFWSGVVAPGYWSAIVLGTLWFVACSVLFGRLGKARPELRLPLRATFLTCSALAVVGFYWTSIRDTVVDEDVVVGVPASKLPKTDVDPLAPQVAGQGGQPERVTRPAPAVQAEARDPAGLHELPQARGHRLKGAEGHPVPTAVVPHRELWEVPARVPVLREVEQPLHPNASWCIRGRQCPFAMDGPGRVMRCGDQRRASMRAEATDSTSGRPISG